jgi:hypothetical protein
MSSLNITCGGILLIMNKNRNYLFPTMAVLIILIIAFGIFIKVNDAKDSIFSTKKLNVNTSAYKKINDKVSRLVNGNGVYLLNIGEENETYLILDGSHLSLNNEVPYYTKVKFENEGNSIMIYFNENLEVYSEGKHPELRLIFKITKDKDTEYIRVFKNGEETHFESVIGS